MAVAALLGCCDITAILIEFYIEALLGWLVGVKATDLYFDLAQRDEQ